MDHLMAQGTTGDVLREHWTTIIINQEYFIPTVLVMIYGHHLLMFDNQPVSGLYRAILSIGCVGTKRLGS